MTEVLEKPKKKARQTPSQQDRAFVNIKNESEAARIVLDAFREEIAGDEEMRVATVESQTGLLEAIEQALMVIQDAEDDIVGIKARVDALTLKKKKAEDRIAYMRRAIEGAMTVAEIRYAPLPCGVKITLSDKPREVEVTEESAIPAVWWKPSDPRLDKAGLKAHLRARQGEIERANEIQDPELRKAALARVDELLPAIPGAGLDNGGVTLRIG